MSAIHPRSANLALPPTTPNKSKRMATNDPIATTEPKYYKTRMKVFMYRLAVTSVIAALISIAAYTVLLEIFVMYFAPNVMLALELPVLFAVLCLAAWRLLKLLHRLSHEIANRRQD